MDKPIFDGPILKMSRSRFQSNAPFLQNTGLYTRIFENTAIFIRVVVVLRPRAMARSLTARTCADLIQSCCYKVRAHLSSRCMVFITIKIFDPGGVGEEEWRRTRIWKGRGCLTDILNSTLKGDWSGRGLRFFWRPKIKRDHVRKQTNIYWI